ncbi:tetraspanin-9-like [Cimex lectularius]|uniref:Tetraspanin n=1 Tax=Cimex lectularius TaxID=79782 RepID=A0A8I6S3P4_CIMLE|nr:tetraspanin-9-like [Cimex lectularius]
MCWPKKIFLLIVNSICGFLGLAVIGFGIKFAYDGNTLAPFIQQYSAHISIALIVTGIFTFGISSMGCIGVFKEDGALLKMYGCALIVIVVIQLLIGIIAFFLVSVVRNHLKSELNNQFEHYSDHKNEIDKIQQLLLCCSAFGLKKWDIDKLPPTCCGKVTGECPADDAFTSNCFDKIEAQVKTNLHTTGILCLCFLVFEITCIVFAFCISSSYHSAK